LWLKNNPDKMKEIEEKIKEKASEVVLVSKKSKKAAAREEAAAAAATEAAETFAGEGADIAEAPEKPPVNVIIDADDDFEEFTPVK